jgi:hypothetical protein
MSDQPTSPPTLEAGIYKHYKGKHYEVIGVALHSETLEPVVVYKPLYESVSEYWVRPYDMFVENVLVDGISVPRFARIKE